MGAITLFNGRGRPELATTRLCEVCAEAFKAAEKEYEREQQKLAKLTEQIRNLQHADDILARALREEMALAREETRRACSAKLSRPSRVTM